MGLAMTKVVGKKSLAREKAQKLNCESTVRQCSYSSCWGQKLCAYLVPYSS